jgi:transcriptional regulator with XRE-family HTH domain
MANSSISLAHSGRGLSRSAPMTKTVHQLPRVPGAQLPLERTRNANFAKRLAKIMADREMTQSKVAAEIWGRVENDKGAWVAKGRDRLSVWVSGKNFPDRENLEKLARALGVSVSDLAPDAELRAAHHGTQPAGRWLNLLTIRVSCSSRSRSVCRHGRRTRSRGCCSKQRSSRKKQPRGATREGQKSNG